MSREWKFGTVVRGDTSTIMVIGRNVRAEFTTGDNWDVPIDGFVGIPMESPHIEDWPLGKSCYISTDPADYEDDRVDWQIVDE